MPDISAVWGVELFIWLLPELFAGDAGLFITDTVTPLSEYLKKKISINNKESQ